MNITDFFQQYVEVHPDDKLAAELTPRINPIITRYCKGCREILSKDEESEICQTCQRDALRGYGARQLLGRLRNGAARDHGILNHAVKNNEWKAVCGAKPGRCSVGWVRPYDDKESITCPRCLKRLPALPSTAP